MTLRVASEALVTVARVRAADNCGCVTPTVPSDAELQAIIDSVSDDIAIVTGGVISGRQAVIARPCRTADWCSCVCCDLDAIPLGDERPEVTEVKIDGTPLDPSAYWVHWNNIQWMIARKPTGTQTSPPHWPSWQKRWRDDTEPDTFSIAFTRGIHIDDWKITAAALEMVCDRVASGGRQTRVMEGISQITVGGTTAVVDDDRLKRIAAGTVGPAMQQLMGIVAPGGRAHSMVWSPEVGFGWDLFLTLP